MKIQAKTIWLVPTICCSLVGCFLSLLIIQKPISGLIAGFFLGQLVSFATWAVEDCHAKENIFTTDTGSIGKAFGFFCQLWGEFLASIFKISLIGYGIFFGIFLLILIIAAMLGVGL